MHAVLQSYLDALRSRTFIPSYEINSWRDLERWFLDHVEFQKRFRMTRTCPIGTVGKRSGRKR